MFAELSPEQRLLLLKFACAYAWVDNEVRPAERRFIERLMKRLDLSDDERAQVESWLDNEPSPASVDAGRVPSDHKKAFLDLAREVMFADGELDALERERLEQLRAALG